MSTASPGITEQPLWFVGNLAYVHIDGTQTTDAYSLVELSGRRGDMAPLHVHHRDDETFYVIDGELTLFCGERRTSVPKGAAALAPRGVAHTYRVESEHARWLVINSPAGFERFIRDAGEPAPCAELPPLGRPFDPAALAAAASEYGIEILGPPGALPGDQES